MDFPVVPLLIAIALAGHGLRKKSLSPSGAFAAFVVGFIMLSAPARTFGVSLIIFYLVGSRATKVGKQLKVTFEEGHQEAGYRTAQQVVCNSFSAFLATACWKALFGLASDPAVGTLPAWLTSQSEPYDSDVWCPLSETRGNGWSRFLLLVALGWVSFISGV